jgi:hypothetical protein
MLYATCLNKRNPRNLQAEGDKCHCCCCQKPSTWEGWYPVPFIASIDSAQMNGGLIPLVMELRSWPCPMGVSQVRARSARCALRAARCALRAARCALL